MALRVSRDMRWIAISNHNTRNVLLYENRALLNESSDPDGILRGVYYPHGLTFTSDGHFILVADAGSPYVHLYEKDVSDWRGVHNPLLSLRVLNDKDFLRGRQGGRSGPKGGPRGVDIDNSMNIFVTTCEIQPLGFFDLKRALEKMKDPKFSEIYCQDQRYLGMKYELDLQLEPSQEKARKAVQIASLMQRRSWRVTAPLRWIWSALNKFHFQPAQNQSSSLGVPWAKHSRLTVRSTFSPTLAAGLRRPK